MQNRDTVSAVVAADLCTGCGTCVALCPKNAINLYIDNRKGIYLPAIDSIKCNQCGTCYDACPGQGLNHDLLVRHIFGQPPEDILLGNTIRCYWGFSNDYKIRYDGASGGLVTGLLIAALDNRSIDGALVTRMNIDHPFEPESFIAQTKQEIEAASKSKYCPVPANVALNEIISNNGRYAVVGLPCHMHGIRKAEMFNNNLKERIRLHIGLFCCGHTDNFHYTQFVLNKYEIPSESVNKLDYRGNGWPGFITITHKDGNRNLIPLHKWMKYHNYGFFSPHRCALCYDGLNDLSDISFGDSWLPEMRGDTIGTSVVISRTEIGEKFLNAAIQLGTITLHDIETNRIKRMELKKTSYRMKSAIARLLGHKCPNYDVKLPIFSYTFPPPPIFYLCMVLSERQYWWLIDPLGSIFETIVSILKHIRNLWLDCYLWISLLLKKRK